LRRLAVDHGARMAQFGRVTMKRAVREEFKERGLK
jgi:hypothetical protein